jgi:signal transduction histidine kinase
MSGLDVLHQISAADTDFITVMITAYASIETAVAATKRGAFDFLAKPFTPEELKAAVYKAAKHLMLARHARALREEKKRLRFELISIVAHELKAPLAAVEQYLAIIADDLGEGDVKASREMIGRSLSRIRGMRKLILDLLDLTRIESGQRKREISRQDLAAVAADVIQDLAAAAREKNIAVTLDAPAPVTLLADRAELEMVIGNLVSNGVKYNRAGGKVEVSVRSRENGATIEVADDGIGMSGEETARLFGEFVRIKNEKTEDIPGSGLGLSIVKKVAELYGGGVSVKSEPGRGSVFTVVIGNG